MDEHRDEGGEEEADEWGDQAGRVAEVCFAVRQALLPSALSLIGFLNHYVAIIRHRLVEDS